MDNAMDAQEIIERIMTMHWDMVACHCWVCNHGKKLGFGAREEYLEYKNDFKYAHIPMPEWEKEDSAS